MHCIPTPGMGASLQYGHTARITVHQVAWILARVSVRSYYAAIITYYHSLMGLVSFLLFCFSSEHKLKQPGN